jgi:signal transduction histidine kinase
MKYQVKNADGAIIISNSTINISEKYIRRFSYNGSDYLIYLEPENDGETKSGRIRKSNLDILESTTKDFLALQEQRFNKYNHIIQTISTQIFQKIEGYFGDEKWYSNDYDEALKNIENHYLNNKHETNRLIHYFNKMSIDLRSHLDGWGIIYIKETYEAKFAEVSLKKAIINQLASFAEDFSESGIKIRFSEDFLDVYTVRLDKKLFSLIMYNFFSNALKYSMPNQPIWMNYFTTEKKLAISMYSVRIEKNEMAKIFEDGVRGINANRASSSGNGSGLYVIKKALKLMGLNNMYITPEYINTKELDNIQYCKNCFIFNFK